MVSQERIYIYLCVHLPDYGPRELILSFSLIHVRYVIYFHSEPITITSFKSGLTVTGVCVSGDYSTSSNCSATLHSYMNVTDVLLSQNISESLINSSNAAELAENATFSYETCPDVLECYLGIARCDGNSTCINTLEGYDCECNRG